MSTIEAFVNIPDQKRDMETIAELIHITTIGIEAVTHIYDDHSLDANTFTKMFALQENLVYRIFTSFHQYELLIAGLNSKLVVDLEADPYNGNLKSHPTIYRFSNELSSIVDSIFFHLCSVFDYLAHFISYMFEKNKDNTVDWGSLANKARAAYKKTLKSAEGIDEVDKKIRIRLEWHRSQLIHRKRDLRGVGITKNHDSNQLLLIFAATPETMKRFKNIIPGYDSESKYTLDCLPSAVFYQTLQSINYLLDFLRVDLLTQSTFEENVKNPKRNDLSYVLHPITKKPHPKSEVIWGDYKRKLNQFYYDYEQRQSATKP
jgi:hypothetical protein